LLFNPRLSSNFEVIAEFLYGNPTTNIFTLSETHTTLSHRAYLL